MEFSFKYLYEKSSVTVFKIWVIAEQLIHRSFSLYFCPFFSMKERFMKFRGSIFFLFVTTLDRFLLERFFLFYWTFKVSFPLFPANNVQCTLNMPWIQCVDLLSKCPGLGSKRALWKYFPYFPCLLLKKSLSPLFISWLWLFYLYSPQCGSIVFSYRKS